LLTGVTWGSQEAAPSHSKSSLGFQGRCPWLQLERCGLHSGAVPRVLTRFREFVHFGCPAIDCGTWNGRRNRLPHLAVSINVSSTCVDQWPINQFNSDADDLGGGEAARLNLSARHHLI